MKKYILFLILFFVSICSESSSEIITLKTGEAVKGEIIRRDSAGIFIFPGYGSPLEYSIDEIEKIEIEDGIETYGKKGTQIFYGVYYDVSSLGDNYDISDLIISLSDIVTNFGIVIEGVKVLDKGIGFDFARIALTSGINQTNGASEERKYILLISPDLAYNPTRIIKVLRKEPLTKQESLEAKARDIKSKAISSFLGRDQTREEDTSQLSAKIANGVVHILDGLRGKKGGVLTQKEDVKVYDYYLSFNETFGIDDSLSVYKDTEKKEKEDSVYVKKEYFDNGNVSGEYSYKNNQLDGISREYYENGMLKIEMKFDKGIRSGIYREYAENGNLIYTESYKNGIIHGPVKEFFSDGTLSREIIYKNGVIEGSVKEYYTNGILKSNIMYREDKKDGEGIFYYESGNIFKKVNYSQGEEDGLYQEFYDGGGLRIEMMFKNGKRYGEFKEYFKDGTLAYMEKYEDGLVNGIAKEFYPNGELATEITYDKGKAIKQVFYDENGNILPYQN